MLLNKIPRYRQIAATIKKQISAGKYQPGQSLPTEAQLREEFSVSRVTIRQAIKLLVDEDILESIQGSGTYVRRKRVNHIYQMTSMDEKLENMDVNTRSEVISSKLSTLPKRLPPPLSYRRATASLCSGFAI